MTMTPEARFTWRQRPPPSLAPEALIPTTDTLQITTTPTTVTIKMRTDNRWTTRNLRGRLLLCTRPTLKIPTRTEVTPITSNRGMDTVNRISEGAVMGRADTDMQCSPPILGCSSTLVYIS